MEAEALIDALSALHRSPMDHEPLRSTLESVAALAVAAVPGCGMAGVTAMQERKPFTVAYVGEQALAVDLLRARSQALNIKLRDVAEQVVFTGSLPD